MKRFTAFILVLMLLLSYSLSVNAAALDFSSLFTQSYDLLNGSYSGQKSGGIPNGSGTVTWEECSYSGNFKNGHPSGEGTFYFADGSCKTGSRWGWVSGKYASWVPERQGADMYYTGMTYDGEFYGYGKLEFNAGGTFQGEFQKGDPKGWGIYTYRSPKSEKKTTKESDNWKTHYKNQAHDHTYTGLAIGKTWQGFGIGITKNKYAYCGEIVSNYRDGHGELYTAKDKLQKWGMYRDGKLKKSYSLP